MKITAVLKDFHDSPTELGNAIGRDRQVVQGWIERGNIPLDGQIDIEVATKGKHRSELTDEQRKALKRKAA
jgi:hypothetical protein